MCLFLCNTKVIFNKIALSEITKHRQTKIPPKNVDTDFLACEGVSKPKTIIHTFLIVKSFLDFSN